MSKLSVASHLRSSCDAVTNLNMGCLTAVCGRYVKRWLCPGRVVFSVTFLHRYCLHSAFSR